MEILADMWHLLLPRKEGRGLKCLLCPMALEQRLELDVQFGWEFCFFDD